MSTNSGIEFATPKLSSISLIDIDQLDNDVEYALSDRAYPSYPPLRLSQILQLIKNGSADAITLIEWLSVFNDDFDALDSEQQNEACILLWKAIAENPRVAGLALHMAANSISDKAKKFPICLIDSMSIAKNFLAGKNQLRVKWLIALSQKDYLQCVELSIVAGYSPFRFSTILNLAELGTFRESVVNAFVPYIKSNFDHKNLSTFELCIKDMTESEKIVTYDALLQLSDKILSHFDSNIQSRCLPDSNDTLWYELSQSSRDRLKQRFQLGGYFVLKSLVDKICQKNNLISLGLDERDVRQLKSRAAFWSNYSDSFNQVRLLIPDQTAKCIDTSNVLETSDIIVLPNSKEECAEVFVFELSSKIVVEVLRGPASEFRLFDLTARNQSRLLKDKHLTLRKIREMACTFIQDHVKLWQYFSEKSLRTEFNIYPNQNTEVFKGQSEKYGVYNKETGLPEPYDSEIDQRQKQLDRWSKIFWDREAKIKNLGSGALRHGWKQMQSANLALAQGNSTRHMNLVAVAAGLGNPEAICINAVVYLNNKNKTSAMYKDAEKQILWAIEQGYAPAKDIAEKYAIKHKENASSVKEEQSGHLNKEVKNNQTIPSEIVSKILKNNDRPYVKLKIDDLEVISDHISGPKMKDKLISELLFRMTKKRNTALLERLKEM